MKAIIMAGGEGTRLRPLTCDCPKPMMRLMDRPVMEYALCLLREHGINSAAVTLGYLPERIPDYFGDGGEFGVNLTYYTERAPLGTAGGVRQARDMLDETFAVLSGDGVTDCDLTRVYEFHKSRGAKATVVLKRVANPMAYGLVITDETGRITRFLEKPGWGEVVTDAVNTGIYIIEPEVLGMIPEGPYDFGRELLPKMAEEGGLYGCVTEGYWCDIGDIGAYMCVCRDALDGKIKLPLFNGAKLAPSAFVDESAVIESPCFIGENAVVEAGASVGAYSVIGKGARVSRYAGLKRAVLWPGARLMEGAQARGCVLAKSAALGAMARAYENSVLGTGAATGTDSEIAPGVGVWPGKFVADATLQGTNLVWGRARAACFKGGALPVGSPSEALLAAQAFAARMKPREVLLARAPSAVSCAMWHGCASGLMAQGVKVLDAGVCSEPQLRFAVTLMRADGALLADAGDVMPINGGGCQIPLSDQRGICALMARQDYPQPFAGITHPVTASARSERAYCAFLASAFSADKELAPPIAVHSADQCLLNLAEQAFLRAGLRARVEWEDEMMELSPGEIGVWLENGGASARFSHAGGDLSAAENEMLLYWTALSMGETELLVTPRATGGVSALAERYGSAATRVSGGRPAFERALTRFPEQFRLHTDGIYLAMAAISALTLNAMTLAVWRETCPRMRRAERRIGLADDLRGRILRALAEKERVSPEDGITIERENVRAWITPDETLPECRIIAEAFQSETAEEFCDFCEKELRELIGN